MKKILFLLLLCATTIKAQTYQNPTFGTVKTKTAPTVTTTPNLATVETDGTISKITPENLPLSTATIDSLELKALRESGVLDFDGLAINADPTKFDIGAGFGFISNSLTGGVTKVTWTAQTAQTTPYLATSVATYVLKDDTGTTVLQNSYPTNEQFRTHIYLGKLAHTTFTTISFVVNDPSRSFSVAGDFHDFVNSIGSINIEGNAITPNGANLNINVSAGRTYREGANFMNNRNSPNITTEPAVNTTAFRNKFRNGSGGWSAVNTSTVDPNYYDNGSGILQLVANNKFTVKVVYRFGGTGTIHMDYGQVVYDDLNAADAGIANSVASDPDTKGFASRIGWIIVKQGTTSLLTSGNYKFVAADLFGVRAATSAPATTLQAAYDGSVTPQITTSTGGGAVTIRRGSAADTDNVLSVQNGAGTVTAGVTGNGAITGLSYNGYTPANDSGVIHKNSTPETKIGSLTLGENLTHASDNWIALGTSVTFQNFYTAPLAKQFSIIQNNFGVAGSTTNDLPARYGDIPTLNSGNIDSYRLLSLEYGINDAAASIAINTYKTNLTNAILNAKSKGWANNKILIVNSNYCSRSDLDTELEPYAIAAIEVAISEGVQYVDIYNYTKNNGGGTLLSDGVHPTAAGGVVYARGVAVLMNGGMELENINAVHSLEANIIKSRKDSEISGLTVGKGNSNLDYNTAIGYQALYTNSTGTANTALGYQSLSLNTTGGDNTALGARALPINTTGFQNTALGSASLFLSTTGSKNTAVGYYAQLSNTTGSDNTAVGHRASYSNSTGTKNIAIGTDALFSNTGDSNTAIGFQSLYTNTGASNSAIGQESLYSNTSGGSNGALGFWALKGNTTGNNNNAVGVAALISNTTGSGNNALGYTALFNSISGSNNTAIGHGTAMGLTTGSGNTIIGANVTGLSSGLANNIILANGTGAIKAQHDGTDWTFTGGVISPSLTGTPTAPTATAGTNTTQIATTAFVQTANSLKQNVLTNPLTGVGSQTDPSTYALQDGTTLYHSVKWFVPTGTVSTSGTTVTSVGTQFTSAMVGAKLIINGEWRIITAFISTTVVTVASAYSVNYSGVVAGSWGVYSKSYEVTLGSIYLYSSTGLVMSFSGLIGTSPTFSLLPNQSIQMSGTNSGVVATNFGFFNTETVLSNAYTFKWSSTTDKYGTKDLGLRRNAAGVLEIYDGITATGLDANRRDLLVRNLTITGTPTAPTATSGTNTTQIATTAFVQTANSNNVKLTGESNQTIFSDIDVEGTLTAASFIKEGAVTGQLLRADGSSTVGYKVYTALLTQSGTSAPTATILENTIGAIVWTRGSNGNYTGTLSGAFTANKTLVFLTNPYDSSVYSISSVSTGANTVSILTQTAGVPTDDLLTGQATSIEIRVYN